MLEKFIRTSTEQKLAKEAHYCENKQRQTSKWTRKYIHRFMHEDNHTLETVT